MVWQKFLENDQFVSYDDFMNGYKLNVPENFNFSFDVVDAWAESEPDKIALIYCDDEGFEKIFTFKPQVRSLNVNIILFNQYHFAGLSLISNVSLPPLAMSLCSMYGRLCGLPLSFILFIYILVSLLLIVSITNLPPATVSSARSTIGEPNQ